MMDNDRKHAIAGKMFMCGRLGCVGGQLHIRMPERPAIYGLWRGELHSDGHWMLLGAEDGAGVFNMPHCFFSREDAENWRAVRPDFGDYIVLPLNEQAANRDKEAK